MRNIALSLALAIASLAPAASAFAAPAAQAQVRTDDLNLTTPEGVATLRQRVRHAAVAICAAGDNQQFDADICRAATLKEMEPQIRASIDRAVAQAHPTTAKIAAADQH